MGIFPQRLLEVSDGLRNGLLSSLVEEVTAAQVSVVRSRIGRCAAGQARLLGGGQPPSDFVGDRQGHLPLQPYDVCEVPLIGLRPQVPVGPRQK